MEQPIRIPITQNWRKDADQYAKAAGYPSMRTGKLAEYAVAWYFRKHHVPVREDQTPKNEPDYFDINLGNTLVDVKSCLAPAKELRITKSLFDRGRRFAFYIGVQVARDRKQAKLFGFCKKVDVPRAKTKWVGNRKVYAIPFSQLEPIQKLVNAFQKE